MIDVHKQVVIYVHKPAGRKNAVKINCVDDIPKFLYGSVDIGPGDLLYLDCVEGSETCPLGSVIGYEKSENTVSGYNCWCIGNAATNLVEINGVFYNKATIMPAMKVSEEFPDFLKGAKIWRNDDGSWSIETPWGISTGFPGEAYWIKYGVRDDGTPDANILTKSEESYKGYIVCDANGIDIGLLHEIDPV